MKTKAVAALLATVLAAACASAPPPPPPVTPTEKQVEESSRRGAVIGRIIGTVAGVLTALETGNLGAVVDFGEAGADIGFAAGAAHGNRIGSEFDEQENELLLIDGVDVARPRGDTLEIRATAEAMVEVAKNLARYERDVEVSAATPERARETVEVLVANGVARGDITVHVDPYGPELVLRIR